MNPAVLVFGAVIVVILIAMIRRNRSDRRHGDDHSDTGSHFSGDSDGGGDGGGDGGD